ncbi:MAG: transposase [Chloroflexota bacterium]|jgi:REP element-mobilizing transposase RayT
MAKNRLSYKIDYRRNLPHIQPPGASLFVTFRLAGSLPASVQAILQAEIEEQEDALQDIPDATERARRQYEAQKQHFGRWDAALDVEPSGPHWLKEPRVAQLVADSIHHLDGSLYDLDSFCIMSNHVHMLFTPVQEDNGAYYGLARIMHSLKGYTAKQANQLMGRAGQFWQRESYDHIVRDPDEFLRIRHYILNNPVKAGLVERWLDWPYTYCTS